MRGTTSLKLYIYAFARRRRGSPGNLLIPSKRSTDLYRSLLPWLTKPSEGVSGHPVRMPSCRYSDWIKNLYKLKSRVHPSDNYVDRQRREVSTARARNGVWKKSKVGGWWVLIMTTRSWSDLLRCQSVTSSSLSHDNGFTILHKTTVNYASYLFQVLFRDWFRFSVGAAGKLFWRNFSDLPGSKSN